MERVTCSVNYHRGRANTMALLESMILVACLSLGGIFWGEDVAGSGFCKTAYAITSPECLPTDPSCQPEPSEDTRWSFLQEVSLLQTWAPTTLLPRSMVPTHSVSKVRLGSEA